MCGQFNIKEAIKMEELQNIENIKNKIIPIEEIFIDKQIVKLDDKKMLLFLNGVKLNNDLTDGIYRIYDKYNKFIGVGQVEQRKLKRDVVL